MALSFNLATSAEIALDLGSRLRQQRLSCGLRQGELAARAGTAEATLRHLERRGVATIDSFIKIVLALGLANELSHLFKPEVKSIKAMEQPGVKRQRAPRKPK